MHRVHISGNGNLDFEEGSKVCIIKDVDGHQWERSCRGSTYLSCSIRLKKLRDLTF
jgi:hypothetical protein